jgi:hypothetical protein
MVANCHHNIEATARYKMALCFLALFLSLPLAISFFTDHNARSKWENRPLAHWPEWEDWHQMPKYFKGLNQFTEDHIGLALACNRIYRQLLFYCFADTPATNISLGKSNHVFLNSHSTDAPHQIFETLCVHGDDKATLQQLTATIADIFQAVESRSYRLSIGIAPSAPILYPDHLPDQVPIRYREACATYRDRDNIPEQLGKIFSAQQKVFYYPLAGFLDKRQDPFFWPKENFHWHGASAHLFAQGFLHQLGLQSTEDFSAGKKLQVVAADLSEIFGFNRSINIWHYPYDAYQTKITYSEPAFVKEYYQRAEEYNRFDTEHPMSERRALLISNSFGVYVAPHLAPGFRSLIHININYLQKKEYHNFFHNLIDRINPTDIILMIHDDELIKQSFLSNIKNHLQSSTSTNINTN